MRIGAVLAVGLSLAFATLSLNFQVVSGSNTEPGLELIERQTGSAPDHAVVLADIKERQEGVRAAHVFPPDDRFPVTTPLFWLSDDHAALLYTRTATCRHAAAHSSATTLLLTAAHCLLLRRRFRLTPCRRPGASKMRRVSALLTPPTSWCRKAGPMARQDPPMPRASFAIRLGIVVSKATPSPGARPYPSWLTPRRVLRCADNVHRHSRLPAILRFGSMLGADRCVLRR